MPNNSSQQNGNYNPNLTNKHSDINTPQPNQSTNYNQYDPSSVISPAQEKVNTTLGGVNQGKFINPNNFEKVLGAENVIKPASAAPAQTPSPIQIQQELRGAVPQPGFDREYRDNLERQAKSKTPQSGHEMLQLIIYIVPLVAIFFLLLKSIKDKDFMWHVKQSLVAQVIWFSVIIIVSLMDLIIISTLGLTIWKIVGYLILLYTGAMAYSNEKFQIPLAYDIGKNFIEEE